MKKTFIIQIILAALIAAPIGLFAQTTIPFGGTGWATSTPGDLFIGTTSQLRYTRLPIGSSGRILQSNGTTPQWVATSSLGIGDYWRYNSSNDTLYPATSTTKVGIGTSTNITETLTLDGTYYQYLPNGGYFSVDDSGDYDRFSVDLHAAPLSGFPRAYMFLNAEEGFTVSPDANTGVSFSLNNGGYQFNYQTHSNSYDANGWVITNATSSGGFFKTVLGGFLMGYDNLADGSSAYIGQISNWGKAAVNVHGTNATEGVMAASDYETFMWLNAPADEGTLRIGQTATSSYIRTTGNLPFYILNAASRVGIGTSTPEHPFVVASTSGQAMFSVRSTGALGINNNVGTAGQVLQSNGNAAPTWVATSSLGTGQVAQGGSSQVAFYSATSSIVQGQSVLFVNATTSRVGIASSTPAGLLGMQCTGNSTGLCIYANNSSGFDAFRLFDSGSAIFGRNLTQLTATPITLSLGGSYGNGAPGSATNLKFDLYNDGTTRNGIGMSAALMELRVGTGNAIGIYTNNGTLAAMFTSAQRFGLGTSTPAFQYEQFSTGTTTMSIDSNSSNKGACLRLKDADGSGYTYLLVNDGAGTFSTTACN